MACLVHGMLGDAKETENAQYASTITENCCCIPKQREDKISICTTERIRLVGGVIIPTYMLALHCRRQGTVGGASRSSLAPMIWLQVSTKSQEQGSPPRSLTDSGITTTSGGGGCGGAPVARPIEDLHLAPGSISLRPAGDEDISTTQDTAEISSIPVEQAFPHLCHAVALIGSSSQSPTAPSSGINIFDFDMPLPYSAGGDGDGNPFGLSAAMLSEVSCLCSSDTVVVFTGNNDIDDKAAGFIDDMSLELVDEEVGADQRLAQISGMNPSHNFVI